MGSTLDAKEQEFYINWIISDYIPFECDGKSYYIGSPSPRSKFISTQIYYKYYEMGIEEGLYTQAALNDLLTKYKIWDEVKEVQLTKLTEDVDEIKIKIYENYTKSNSKEEWRRALEYTNEKIEEYWLQKHYWDSLGAESLGQMAQQQYLLGASIYTVAGKPYWKSNRCWELPDCVCNLASVKVAKYKLNLQEYRCLSRCGYWRNMWNINKGNNLFGKPVTTLSDPQRNLMYWSRMYENIYKSPDCPSDEIVEDDDALDGWLILQRRKREKESNVNTINQMLTNEKIKNSEHVFIMADEKDIDKVYEMNDISGKIALQKRLGQINREGLVKEVNMIDTREMIKQQYVGG